MELPKKLNHVCTFCGFKCASKSGLEYHIRQHTGEKPFVCDKCNRGFADKSLLNKHVRGVHLRLLKKPLHKGKYDCSLCSYTTVYKSNLQDHILTHTGERAFPCKYKNCYYAANCSTKLLSHTHHKHNDERPYLCKFPSCDYRGKTKAVLKRHSLTHSEHRPYVCDFAGCNFRATRKDALSSHQAGVHARSGSKPFACLKCNHRTHSQRMLRQHEVLVHTESSIKCNITGCAYSFKFESQLKRHILDRHMPEGTFKCDVAGCLATTARPYLLRQHKIKAHGHGHQCPFCDFRVDWQSHLRRHIERHHTNKQIPCPVSGCPFQAKHRGSLRLHMRYHEDNLNCTVEGCGYVGISSQGWKRHMQFHDPTSRPYKCPLCPKYFSKSSIRSSHLKSHTKEKPFRCPACNFGATNPSAMTSHVRSMHPNTFPDFVFDNTCICDHCGINFGCAVGLAMHNIKLKTAVVVLRRLQIKY